MSENQLVEYCGLDKESAKRIKQNINQQRELSEKELKEEYCLSDVEVMIFKNALCEHENYVPPKKRERELSLSSTLSSSYINFYEIVLDQSSKKSVQYNVSLSFNWLKPCWNGMLDDTIAVSWGGKLNYKSGTVSKKVYYKNFSGIYPAWEFVGKINGTKSPSAEIAVNKGVKYSFPQQYDKWSLIETRIKEGLIQFQIGNDVRKNRSTQIKARYCHQIISLSSPSISLSGPGISVNSAYECTDDDKNCTDIKY